MVKVAHLGFPFRYQPCQHHSGACSKVSSLYLTAREGIHAFHHGSTAINLDVCPHTL